MPYMTDSRQDPDRIDPVAIRAGNVQRATDWYRTQFRSEPHCQDHSRVQPCRFPGCHWRRALFGYFLILLASAPAQADNFPMHVSVEQRSLERTGQGTARYASIIPVYDIALYTEPAQHPRQLLDPRVAKRLDIVYRVAIQGDKLALGAEKILASQHAPQRLAKWRSQIDALHSSYTDVEPGDRHTLSYLPQHGLWLEFNGKPILTLADDEFAAIYFGIWLGEKPLSEPLRLQLTASSGTGEQPVETALTP